MDVLVVKRDGSKEPFQMAKVQRVVTAAGLNSEQATQLAMRIAAWVKNLQVHEIPSLQIRDQVITELQKVSPYSAGLFTWYQKSKTS